MLKMYQVNTFNQYNSACRSGDKQYSGIYLTEFGCFSTYFFFVVTTQNIRYFSRATCVCRSLFVDLKLCMFSKYFVHLSN